MKWLAAHHVGLPRAVAQGEYRHPRRGKHCAQRVEQGKEVLVRGADSPHHFGQHLRFRAGAVRFMGATGVLTDNDTGPDREEKKGHQGHDVVGSGDLKSVQGLDEVVVL